MQIFRLSVNNERNARAYPDKYTYNQVRESARAMTTALEVEGVQTPYGVSHEHHPIVQWLRKRGNWLECYEVTKAVHDEYQRRYGNGVHDSWKTIDRLYQNRAYSNLPEGSTLQPCAFDDKYKLHPNPLSMWEVVENYRNYVKEVKAPKDWFKYNHGTKPAFLGGVDCGRSKT